MVLLLSTEPHVVKKTTPKGLKDKQQVQKEAWEPDSEEEKDLQNRLKQTVKEAAV